MTNWPNAALVLTQPGSVEMTEVTVKGKGYGTPRTVKGGDVRGTITLFKVDWHPKLIRSAEWTRQRYDEKGREIGGATSGKLIGTNDEESMIKRCLDHIFGGGTWVLAK